MITQNLTDLDILSRISFLSIPSSLDQHHALTKSLLSIASCFSFHAKEQGTEPHTK
jgi:hypothetical protein